MWSQIITTGQGALLQAGSTSQWRILLHRLTAGTTGELTNHRCQLKITLPVDAVF